MITKIFAIKDSKAGAFLRPFFVPNEAVAIRAVSEAFYDESSDFYRHATDYDLYELGEYDDISGKLDTQPPAHVVSLTELKFSIENKVNTNDE